MSTAFRKGKHAASRLNIRAARAAKAKERIDAEQRTWWDLACAQEPMCRNLDDVTCVCRSMQRLNAARGEEPYLF